MKKIMIFVLIIPLIMLSACNAVNQPVSASTLSDPVIIDNEPIVAEGDLQPSKAIELAFQQSGQITEVLVNSGDTVNKGDQLALIQGYEQARAHWLAAKLEYEMAQQSLDELTRNALASDVTTYEDYQTAQEAYEKEANRWSLGNIEKATALELLIDDYVDTEESYQDARDDLLKYDHENVTNPLRENAQQTYDDELKNLSQSYQDLQNNMPDSQDLLEEKQLDTLMAIGELEIARAKLDRLENGLDYEMYNIAKSKLDTAEQNIAAAEEIMTTYMITAPINGKVLSISKMQTGDQAYAGQPIIFIGDTNQWMVETIDLAEIDITRVSIGKDASIKLDGIPTESFHGFVTEIDQVGQDYLGDNTYQVTITLDDYDPRFLWNMTATVNID